MIKQIQKGREEFEKKFKKYDKDGGFIVYVPGYDNNDFDVESIVEEFTQQQIALLLEVKKWAEENKKKDKIFHGMDCKEDRRPCGQKYPIHKLADICERENYSNHNQALEDLIQLIDKSIKENK